MIKNLMTSWLFIVHNAGVILLNKALQRKKLPPGAKIVVDILINWDSLGCTSKGSDFCGNLLSEVTCVHAGPNVKNAIIRPTSHAQNWLPNSNKTGQLTYFLSYMFSLS